MKGQLCQYIIIFHSAAVAGGLWIAATTLKSCRAKEAVEHPNDALRLLGLLNEKQAWTVYAAAERYHHTLVQTRFTVAGLFLAANGFLAGGFFQQLSSPRQLLPQLSLPVLGLLLTLVCYVMELRTSHLLGVLGQLGRDIEDDQRVPHDPRHFGFFHVMKNQPDGVIRHRIGLHGLYCLIYMFWAAMLWWHIDVGCNAASSLQPLGAVWVMKRPLVQGIIIM